MRISSDKKNMNSKWLFISYSRKNKETALRLAKDLKNYGIAVWLDLLNLEPGTHWDIAIQNALEDSRGLIVLLSIPSVASKYVLSEIDCVLEQNKKIIPILLEECRVPLLLRRVQYIDFTQSYDDGYYLLLENFDKYSELDFYSKKEDVRVIEETNEGFVQTNLEEKLISTEEIEVAKGIHLLQRKRLFHLLLALGLMTLGILILFTLNFIQKNLDFTNTHQQILLSTLCILAVLALIIYRKIGDRDSRIQLIVLFELKRNRLERAISKITESDIEDMNQDFTRLTTI